MPNFSKYLGAFTITSSGSTLTNALKGVEDADSIQIYVTTSVGGGFFNVQFSGYDPLTPVGQTTLISSGSFYSHQYILTTSAANLTSIMAGQTAIIEKPGAFQVRLLGTGGETSGIVCGYAIKNIHV